MSRSILIISLAIACGAVAHAAGAPAGSAEALYPRPDPAEEAEMARWLVHATDFGTLATLEDGKPFGGITSHSDGKLDAPLGRLFFYKSPMSELMTNIAHNSAVSYTVTEAQLPGGCRSGDPEDPTCAKVTFMGKFVPVDAKDDKLARAAMFDRHPRMAKYPEDHHFSMYEIKIEEIHLLANFGGTKHVKPKDYFGAELEQATDSEQGQQEVKGHESWTHPHTTTTKQSFDESDAGRSGSGSISFASVWFGAMAGAMCGILLLALGGLGYKMHAERQQRVQYMPASAVVVDK